MKRFLGCVSVFALVACSGQTLDVGSDTGGSGAGASGGVTGNPEPTSLPEWPATSDACATGNNLPVAGVWEGYIEGDSSPTSNVRIEIKGASEAAGVCGTITFGTGTLPPPPTSPDEYYPPASTGYPNVGMVAEGSPQMFGPYPGYPYTLLDGSIVNQRVRFGATYSELYVGWCAMQTPISWGDGQYGAVPTGSGTSTDHTNCTITDRITGDVTTYACDFYWLAYWTCVCTSEACTATPGNGYTSFDIAFDATTATGSRDTGNRVILNRVQ